MKYHLLTLGFILSSAGLVSAQCPMCSATAAVTAEATNPQPLPEPLASVIPSYLKIQQALAQDSLSGVTEAAAKISKVAADDKSKNLPTEVTGEATALAQAKDLATARTSFSSLSQSLIDLMQKDKIQTGKYFAVYCPMVQKNWIQEGKDISNPYSLSMKECGQVKMNF